MAETFGIAHVADEVPDALIIVAARAHFMLLELITAKYDQFFRLLVPEHDFGKFLPE